MKNELLMIRRDDKILSLQIQDGKIAQIHAEDVSGGDEQAGDRKQIRVGDIYVGKVRNIVKNINAAFVEFAKGQTGYLSLAGRVVPVHTQGFPYQEGRVLIGDEILVQVVREAAKTKPPTLSGILDLTGRYMVLSVGKSGCGLSKKIQDKSVRESLLALLTEYTGEGYGLIARTNSQGVPEEILRQELDALLKRYEKLMSHGLHREIFTCLEKSPPLYLCDIRDGYSERVERIVTDDEILYGEIRQYLEDYWPEGLNRLERWNPEHGKLDAVYNVTRTLDHALMPRVWLKSGAYLVIQPTEALVSIDVNTGKAISKKKDVQKTFFRVNCEAAEEIARQLRLRNLSGIILVDFIDMKDEENNQKLLELFRQCVRKDSVQTTVVDMTKLGLVEVTRKKVQKSLYESLKKDRDISL